MSQSLLRLIPLLYLRINRRLTMERRISDAHDGQLADVRLQVGTLCVGFWLDETENRS